MRGNLIIFYASMSKTIQLAAHPETTAANYIYTSYHGLSDFKQCLLGKGNKFNIPKIVHGHVITTTTISVVMVAVEYGFVMK